MPRLPAIADVAVGLDPRVTCDTIAFKPPRLPRDTFCIASLGSILVPTICTDRLVLRGFTRDDTADVFAYAGNPNVSRYMPWETHHSIADSRAFIETVLDRHPHEHTWAICERGSPKVVGAIELGLKADTIAQIDYVLSESYWHRGYMSEAVHAVIGWCIDHYPQVNRVVSCTMAQNLPCRRTLEHCGFQLERVFREYSVKLGKSIEQCQYLYATEPDRDR